MRPQNTSCRAAMAGSVVLALAVAGLPQMATAEMELSVYGGWQTAPHSGVTLEDPVLQGAGASGDFTAGWEGRSADMPPYYGLRATWWRTERLGFGIEVNHAKVYADAETLATSGLDTLEFTDGLNIVTLNAMRRWPDAFGGLTPYVGAGIGAAIPHVEVAVAGQPRTFGYQVTGPAVAWIAGASYPISENWSVFGEYKGTYSVNTADLDSGGTLQTDIVTNAINLGLSFRF